MKVLIADDSHAMHMIIKRTLRLAGFEDLDVVFASDGREALEKIRSERPDVVLSDWNMPEMSGLDVLRAVRAEGIGCHFGFVTTEATDEMRALAKEEGAEFLIAKPFTPETFAEVLGPYLG
ncbi:response regulator [Inmirania thermothiophila]|uniref:Two-component system chemotaxis response regulator CheY n=1 Tax=Inmirania thermothiophila TaxID=1750597 RepID=A0A3N1Y122_9GAMM|nr:response regulator [Inmirania thermothiophila]ROR32516.1 two-component system chemotaxis response regulator CheY [Inmirania thermothiophila]